MTLEDRIVEGLRAPLAPEARTALDLRVRTAMDTLPSRRRRRTWLTRGLVFAGLLAIALPGVIAGDIFLTEGPFGMIDAAHFEAEVEAAKLRVPIPEGRAWPGFLRAADPNASYDRMGGRPWVESVATCIWFDEWLDAREARSEPRKSVAAATIAGIPSWPSWHSRFYDQSYRDHVGSIIAAVGMDDAAPVEAEMRLNCSWVLEE